ncbi:MAG: radical SAM family heme chaperone HemW [Gammaproteobacteria bacterium]|nr:radical SAM family heme chaperone HemW [Gammaproteobacteria bacterium]MDE2262830.1 radical SAM family heme chaperone HemW [Gammaproteobacteria bacterium]
MLKTPPLALYVHFPWCVRKCPYCDFNSYTLHGELEERRYIEALQRDLEAQAPQIAGREVISIFLGGGTPSLFSPGGIADVLDCARRQLAPAAGLEVTLEANPGTIERGRFAEYRAAGVNRVSLGAQSFDDARLAALGRIHCAEETRRAAAELHAAGLDNFNIDLMYGLPGQDVGAALHDVEEALALRPSHLSHYQLTIEAGTLYAGRPPTLPDDDTAEAMLDACRGHLESTGYAQYEVSAYAAAGRRCRHNLNYWAFGDYLGIGAGAHGKLTLPDAGQVVRTTQVREPRRYLSSAGRGTFTRTLVPDAELPFEFMLNALRLVEGFEVRTFTSRTGLPWEIVAETMADLVGEGLIVATGTCYRASPLGLRFLNDVLLRFVTEIPKTVGQSELSTAPQPPPVVAGRALFTGAGGGNVK